VKLKPGVELLSEVDGDGPLVVRHEIYRFALRMWLSRGEPVVWTRTWGENLNAARLEEGSTLLSTELRVDRNSMFAGLFYGVQGMRVGGKRRLRVAPHLGYGEAGVEGTIPPNALLLVEVKVVPRVLLAVGSNAE
jgi:hypothetical protein